MTTENVTTPAPKVKKPRLSPEQKLEALLAQQRELEDRIRKERLAAKRRADEAAKERLARLAQLLVDAGLADLDESALRRELSAIAERLRSSSQPA